jgi:membrane fusion protein (multidrug efflux system)
MTREETSEAPTGPAPTRARTFFGLLVIGLAGAGLFAFRWARRGVESTEDAQIEARVHTIAARTGGVVRAIHAGDLALVQPGDVLAELDDEPQKVSRTRAAAELAAVKARETQVRAQLAALDKQSVQKVSVAKSEAVQVGALAASARAEVDVAKQNVAAARTAFEATQKDLTRMRSLAKAGGATDAELESAQLRFDRASADLRKAEAELSSIIARELAAHSAIQKASLLTALAEPVFDLEALKWEAQVASARVEQAESALVLADLELRNTKIVSPVRGRLAHRAIERGDPVSSGSALFRVVTLEDVWIEAKFKETQIAKLRVGQRAEVVVDAWDSLTFAARIEHVGVATTARFAPIALDGPSGTYVRVTQRVPVLLRFEAPPQVSLQAGLSAKVKVRLDGT